jgi:hypothetical protein
MIVESPLFSGRAGFQADENSGDNREVDSLHAAASRELRGFGRRNSHLQRGNSTSPFKFVVSWLNQMA